MKYSINSKIECGTIIFLVRENPKQKKLLEKANIEFLKTHKHSRKCLENIKKYRDKYPNEYPADIFIAYKKGKCNYCGKTSSIRAQVGVRKKPRIYYAGASCLSCVSSFFPDDIKLVEVKNK